MGGEDKQTGRRRWGRCGQLQPQPAGALRRLTGRPCSAVIAFGDRAVAAAHVSFPARCLCVCLFFLFSLFFVAEKQQTSYPLEKPAHCRQAHSADPQSARSTVEARGAARRRLRRYMHSVDYCLRCLRTPQMVHRAIDDRRTAFHDEPRNMHPSRLWRD